MVTVARYRTPSGKNVLKARMTAQILDSRRRPESGPLEADSGPLARTGPDSGTLETDSRHLLTRVLIPDTRSGNIRAIYM